MFQAMIFSAKSRENVAATALQMGAILRQKNRIKPGDDDDFTIFTQDDIAQATDATYAILNLLLFAVASIALIVGGIGIMNIMYATVTERTREVGIRRAIGATRRDILLQFLAESTMLSFLGETGMLRRASRRLTTSGYRRTGGFISLYDIL